MVALCRDVSEREATVCEEEPLGFLAGGTYGPTGIGGCSLDSRCSLDSTIFLAVWSNLLLVTQADDS